MRCQVVDGGIDAIDQWREILEGKTVLEALGELDDGEAMASRCCAPRSTARAPSSSGSAAAPARVLAVQAVPVRDDRAGVIGVMTVCRDLTPRPRRSTAQRSARAAPTGSPAPSR